MSDIDAPKQKPVGELKEWLSSFEQQHRDHYAKQQVQKQPKHVSIEDITGIQRKIEIFEKGPTNTSSSSSNSASPPSSELKRLSLSSTASMTSFSSISTSKRASFDPSTETSTSSIRQESPDKLHISGKRINLHWIGGHTENQTIGSKDAANDGDLNKPRTIEESSSDASVCYNPGYVHVDKNIPALASNEIGFSVAESEANLTSPRKKENKETQNQPRTTTDILKESPLFSRAYHSPMRATYLKAAIKPTSPLTQNSHKDENNASRSSTPSSKFFELDYDIESPISWHEANPRAGARKSRESGSYSADNALGEAPFAKPGDRAAQEQREDIQSNFSSCVGAPSRCYNLFPKLATTPRGRAYSKDSGQVFPSVSGMRARAYSEDSGKTFDSPKPLHILYDRPGATFNTPVLTVPAKADANTTTTEEPCEEPTEMFVPANAESNIANTEEPCEALMGLLSKVEPNTGTTEEPYDVFIEMFVPTKEPDTATTEESCDTPNETSAVTEEACKDPAGMFLPAKTESNTATTLERCKNTGTSEKFSDYSPNLPSPAACERPATRVEFQPATFTLPVIPKQSNNLGRARRFRKLSGARKWFNKTHRREQSLYSIETPHRAALRQARVSKNSTLILERDPRHLRPQSVGGVEEDIEIVLLE
jgi:hypothetical protein